MKFTLKVTLHFTFSLELDDLNHSQDSSEMSHIPSN